MGSLERSKKKVQLWKKAAVHFALCFVMGFFTGFAPTGKAPGLSSRSVISSNNSSAETLHSPPQQHSSRNLISQQQQQQQQQQPQPQPQPRSSSGIQDPSSPDVVTGTADLGSKLKLTPRRLIIIITPTNARDPHQGVHLRRLANTLRLVPPPLLWVVVEPSAGKKKELSEMLRSTGTMYRHLEYRENFTAAEAELEHQRNLALKHLERHRLSGIVHFAGIHSVYDLDFFDHLRETE
ncbi:unnamed protein product [Linum tenue]|uniref:Glycosyltransferases n=1 Tax=Linum tenue TaxID=586396 RepID=A0AAV0KYK2_9ROSI|nr:unnamed protein product [Linum tenue]